MSNLRRQAATALGAKIQTRARLAQPVTIISAPPSAVSDSPACAVWLERFATTWYQEDEIGLTATGAPKVGALNDMDVAPAALIQSGLYLSKIGALQVSGRIWVGCRLPPQREEMEDRVGRIFSLDKTAIGRLLLSIDRPVVDGVALPFPWTAAVFSDSSEWDAEYAFSERLWSWMSFEMCIDVLIASDDLRVDVACGRLQLAIDADFQQPYDDTGVLDSGDNDAELYVLNTDGSMAVAHP